MSGILHRTAFFGRGGDGVIRFAQWNRVITGLGVMWEAGGGGPAAQRDGYSDFDQADMMARVDAVEGYDPMAFTMGENTTGGYQYPLGSVTGY